MNRNDSSNKTSILLIDGQCVLCSRLANFIAKREPAGNIRFAALQSDAGQHILANIGYPNAERLDSVVWVQDGAAYTKSSAALQVVRQLNGLWPLLYGFALIPSPLRDWAYDRLAARRYRWFGKTDACMLPPVELRQRYIDDHTDR